MSPAQGSSTFRARLLFALKFAFAALMLLLVMRTLPWRDEVTLVQPAGKRVLVGTLLGDWKSDAVRFEFDARVERASLPAEWQAQLAQSRTVELQRSAEVGWNPSVPRVFRSVELAGLGLALGLLCLGVVMQTTRWWRLLAALGCPTGWFNALRLGLYGLFFNLIVPGQAGGDVVKALLVAREHPERRAAAAVSVLIDRFVGLLILVLLCAIVIVLEGDRFAPVRNLVLITLCAGVMAAILYANPSVRRTVNLEHRLRRMPMSRSLLQIDKAFLVYSERPFELLLAGLLSVCVHACVAMSVFVLGRAFGDTTASLMQYFAISSVGNIASALPITPGGWGVGEAVYQYLFELVGADGTIGVAVSITYKLLFGLIGMSGGIFLLLPGGRRQISELRQVPVRS